LPRLKKIIPQYEAGMKFCSLFWFQLSANPWLTPPQDHSRDEQVKAICRVYEEATERAKQEEMTMSTDELTGVHALERKHLGVSSM